MGGLYLESRLEFLRASQNPDGGWSYFPGKGSWLEPTTYAMLALHGTGSDPAVDRAWKLVRSWQRADGSFRPSGEVNDGTWVTAHAVTLASVRGVDDASVRASVDWLLRVVGAEHNMWTRTGSFLHLIKARLDVSHEGWPWREGNATWIEPTAHTLVALKKVASRYRTREVEQRVRDGEELVLSRRCTDGGWNYGTPNMLYFDLPSYPETTALALLGMDGVSDPGVIQGLEVAKKFHAETKSSLGKAWLQIALRCHSKDVAAPPESALTSRDVMLASLEALGHPEGNYKLFHAGGRGMTRRKFALLSGAAIVGGYGGIQAQKLQKPPKLPDGPAGNSAVAIIRARSYSDDLVSRMLEGVRQCGLDVRGKRVLLKPNLVEFDPATVINTNVAVIAAAVEVFHQLGAAEVKIGEGPGHRRDTLDMADDARYRAMIPKFESIFTDLNRDDVSPVKNFAGEEDFYFPNTVLGADLIVSLAKMKTHHWVGATLSMKNFFGVVPGSVYGWPKNKLHYYGIPESIVALNRQFGRKAFAIVDGVIGMEGNGPIQGTPRPAGVLVMGSDLVAVDSTCCRVMGINPEKVNYLRMAADLGHVRPERIDQRGETIASVRTNFELTHDFKDLRLV